MDGVEHRTALTTAAAMRDETLAGLSRWLGRNPAYLQQYVKRGSPRILPERERRRLADYLGVADIALGGPPAPAAGLISVKRIAARAAAGPGGLADDDRTAGATALDARLLGELGVKQDALAMLRAQGDSMAPTIEDGDQMLVDESDRAVIGRGGIYVIRLDGLLMVKRLRRAAGGFDIVSDNPAYPPLFARPDIIGRVVWLSRALK